MKKDKLFRGDLVEIKSATEILSTLDKNGANEGLPFMPEMIRYIGQRFVVSKRVEKICDTIKYTGTRRMLNTVALEDLRCDGSGHNNCQADCRIFWKESWLRKIVGEKYYDFNLKNENELKTIYDIANSNVRKVHDTEQNDDIVYRCQATELFNASTKRLRVWYPMPYIREFICGNIKLGEFLKITARAILWEPLRKLDIIKAVPIKGSCSGKTPDEILNLQPGELVQVKERREIIDTLTPNGRTRGLAFTIEMLPFCGGTYRVRHRVKRFIDDRDGRMIELKRECVTLEGVYCLGDRSPRRWFCPRGVYPYWRESWLRRPNSN